ncbi:class I SAM-dependent methyltransferase [Brevibacillus borstelensis]|uniref:class I SAM-dependent methyltransferase n=1 Tax=Brevibacillus borstelensis TaxID=45462 RepID=UPI000468480A|nr:class I SAM-dependent methyltransferase [Brevibacillus borstelensis]MCC0565756.1 class I SAM-dependent methyltransferase [Brevibacillus borstelensis]MCM3473567.1 class I SAM-dependent methyltransferase [Brevibacillus borstelensis]MCM3624509.1 class I SAM-dependent methyltransferase [Brevibacillus borstelensis]MED1851561.1 class I SAM-dependent methyltransferase [Brevibacillus borstelensis]NOU57416.1 class I SAM-dependent methyltransferase [Brevibacillus borstelensis]
MSMEIFFDIHSNLPREGPGNNDSTRKAFSYVKNIPGDARILDVGCGPGMQTMELAKLSDGPITAVDTHQPFLDELARRAAEAGVSHRITPVNASMFALPFEPLSFDVIWSEGAIYIMGFGEGLRAWRPLLKSGGYLAATELCWLRDERPDEVERFWAEAYPSMKTVEQNLRIIAEAGYTLQEHFVLPDSAWWDDYYEPMCERISHLQDRYKNDRDALATLKEASREVELYRKYSSYYGYVFYVMQKSDSID